MKKIIFLCTGNSCRSQMAEGFAKDMLSLQNSKIDSAGVRADGINKYAIQVMSEIGIDISVQNSIDFDKVNFDLYDLIVTVCDHAHSCLNTNLINYHKNKILNKHIPDPVIIEGGKNINNYRHTRDLVQALVKDLLINYNTYIQDGKK